MGKQASYGTPKGHAKQGKAVLSWVRRLDKGKDEEKRRGRQRRKTRVKGGGKRYIFSTQCRHPLRGMPTALRHGRAALSSSMFLLFKK